MSAVRRAQRWTKERPCPICGGWDLLPRGSGRRCSGYMGHDGKYAHCSREEFAGGLRQEQGETYAHRLEGSCDCGETHGDAPASTPIIDFHERRERRMHDEWREVQHWDYENGLRVVRAEASSGRKTYWQLHRTERGYERGRGDAPLTLYRAPELRAADPQQWVWLVEGEKCADAVAAAGLLSTTTAGGSGGWKQSAEVAATMLKGRHVVILPDNDEPGRKYAAEARATLEKVCASLRVLELPGLTVGEDVVEWLGRGGDPEDLVRLAEEQPDVAEKPKGRIEWISTSAIFAPLPPTRWLSRDLALCPGRPAMIAGYGYSGKTLCSQAAMISMSTGRDIWGRFPGAGRPLRVRHLDFEQGQHATRKRYQRLAVGMGIHPDEIGDRLELAVFPDVYLNSPEAMDVYAKETEGCDSVFLDALRGATPGEDENDSKMRKCLDMLSRVSEKNGVMFAVLHHAGKPKENHRDARMVLRGSSGIFDACGCVLVISADKDKPILVQQAKAPAEAEGTAAPDFHLRIEDVENGVRVSYFEPEKTAEGPSMGRPKETTFEDVRNDVLRVVREEPGLKSANAIVHRCKVGQRGQRLQAITELHDEKRIAFVGGGFYVRA